MSTPEPTAGEDRRHTERRDGERRRLERLGRTAVLALLVGVVAVALAAFLGIRSLRVERELAATREAAAATAAAHQDLARQLAALRVQDAGRQQLLRSLQDAPVQLATLQRDVAGLSVRVDAPLRAAARAEAGHLVVLAARRLQLDRDREGAIGLLTAAESRLREGGISGAPLLAVQQDRAALLAAPAAPTIAVAARIATAESAVDKLPVRGIVRDRYDAPAAQASTATGFARAWERFTGALEELLTVRRLGADSAALVSAEEAVVRRHHLELLLYAARLAAVRGASAEYGTALASARAWLEAQFDARDAGVAALRSELAALALIEIAPALPLPTASAAALQQRLPEAVPP